MKIYKWHIITDKDYREKMTVCAINGFELGKNSAVIVINPVLSDLKKLRNNTWDKELVDQIIGWLKGYMEE